MMKKILFLAMTAFATTALAGEYHVYTTLVCSDCHTMHASRQHSFGQNTQNSADAFVFGSGDTGGHEFLLLAADVNRTCMVCHDGGRGAPDVFGTNQGSTNGLARAGGALNSADTYTAVPNEGGYGSYMGHSLGSTALPPGLNPTVYPSYPADMECNRCHSVHGRSTYRNLRDRGADAVVREPSYVINAGTTPNFGFDVNIFTGGDGYNANNIVYTAAVGAASGTNKMTAFCGMCHGNFHDDVGSSATFFKRHPTDQVSFTRRQLFTGEGTVNATTGAITSVPTNVSIKVTYIAGAAWQWGTEAGNVNPGVDTEMTVGCMTCHKGHGNKNSFGLFLPGNYVSQNEGQLPTLIHNADANKEEGNGTTIRNLCNTCHGQGRTNSNLTGTGARFQ